MFDVCVFSGQFVLDLRTNRFFDYTTPSPDAAPANAIFRTKFLLVIFMALIIHYFDISIFCVSANLLFTKSLIF